MAWRGVAWRGVAWRGVAWRGVAWLGVAWLGVAWRGVSTVRSATGSIDREYTTTTTMTSEDANGTITVELPHGSCGISSLPEDNIQDNTTIVIVIP